VSVQFRTISHKDSVAYLCGLTGYPRATAEINRTINQTAAYLDDNVALPPELRRSKAICGTN